MAEKTYQLSQFVIDGVDEDIRCEEFNVTRELDAEEKTATNKQYFGNRMLYKMMLEKYKQYGLID